jgi:hypothetical protein
LPLIYSTISVQIPQDYDSPWNPGTVRPGAVPQGHEDVAIRCNVYVPSRPDLLGYHQGTKPIRKGEATIVGIAEIRRDFGGGLATGLDAQGRNQKKG